MGKNPVSELLCYEKKIYIKGSAKGIYYLQHTERREIMSYIELVRFLCKWSITDLRYRELEWKEIF